MADIPVVAHRFMVNFLFNTIPAPLDIAFQRVSGLSRELQVSQYREGGENVRNLWLAENVNHGSLLLERGVTNASLLTTQFDRVLRRESTQWANVVIMLLNEADLPVTTWTLSHALPVRWQVGDLDASSNTVLINSLELRYQDMRILGGQTMTVEIRELVIQVQVTESSPQATARSPASYTEWDEQRLLEKLKREVLEYLQERGQL